MVHVGRLSSACTETASALWSGPSSRRGSQEVAMSRYAALLVVPLIVGILIAVTVLLINELRERRERRHTVLREARHLDDPDYATFSATSASDRKDALIASKSAGLQRATPSPPPLRIRRRCSRNFGGSGQRRRR